MCYTSGNIIDKKKKTFILLIILLVFSFYVPALYSCYGTFILSIDSTHCFQDKDHHKFRVYSIHKLNFNVTN